MENCFKFSDSQLLGNVSFLTKVDLKLIQNLLVVHRYSVIPVLGDILNESVKEKVTRITLAVFRNLIEKTDDQAVARENCIQMVSCKVSQWTEY